MMRPDSLTHIAHRITCELGLPELHLHSLRHSWATAALVAGVDVKVVSDVLGHSTTTLTRDVYQHTPVALAAEAQERVAEERRRGLPAG